MADTSTLRATTPTEPRGRAVLAVLRWLTVVHALALFGQPVLAGLLLSGRYEALAWHIVGADLVFALGLGQLVVAIVLWVRTGPRWPAGAALLLVVGETVAYTAGQARALDLHLPLGVALLAISTTTLVALWRPGAVEARGAS